MCCMWKGLLSRLHNVGHGECSLEGVSVLACKAMERRKVHMCEYVCGMRRVDACKGNNIGVNGEGRCAEEEKALCLKVIGPMIGPFPCIVNGEYYIVASSLLLLEQQASAAAALLLLASSSSLISSEQTLQSQ